MHTKINIKTSTNALRERTDTLKRYYEDIRKYDVLSKEEEAKCFEMYKNGTPKEKEFAYNLIINSNQRFVVGVAKRYGTDDNIMDLIEEGNLGLIEAFHKYDLTLGNKFISYAVHYIRRAINHYLVNHNEIVHRCNNHKIYHLASKARSTFVQRNLRQPTTKELLDILNDEFGANLKNENDLIEMQVMSIDMNFDSDTDIHGDDFSIYNDYTSNGNNYELQSDKEYNDYVVKKIISDLTPTEQSVLKMNFGIGYDREYEMQEIAEALGFTSERIRQVKKSALEKMKNAYVKELNK